MSTKWPTTNPTWFLNRWYERQMTIRFSVRDKLRSQRNNTLSWIEPDTSGIQILIGRSKQCDDLNVSPYSSTCLDNDGDHHILKLLNVKTIVVNFAVWRKHYYWYKWIQKWELWHFSCDLIHYSYDMFNYISMIRTGGRQYVIFCYSHK